MTDYVTVRMLAEDNKKLNRWPSTPHQIRHLIKTKGGDVGFSKCVKRVNSHYLINPAELNNWMDQQNI